MRRPTRAELEELGHAIVDGLAFIVALLLPVIATAAVCGVASRSFELGLEQGRPEGRR